MERSFQVFNVPCHPQILQTIEKCHRDGLGLQTQSVALTTGLTTISQAESTTLGTIIQYSPGILADFTLHVLWPLIMAILADDELTQVSIEHRCHFFFVTDGPLGLRMWPVRPDLP